MKAEKQAMSAMDLNTWARSVMKRLSNQTDLLSPVTAKHILARAKAFNPTARQVLVDVLRSQHGDLPQDHPAHAAITMLEQPDAVTVTVGHQLCLGLGPMYVHEKILETLALAKHWQAKGKQVVPLFWMATEDHDFEEIRSMHANGQVYRYASAMSGGPVGKIPASDALPAIASMADDMAHQPSLKPWIDAMQSAYSCGSGLAVAHRQLIQSLYPDILCLDASDTRLKALAGGLFKAVIKRKPLMKSAAKASALWGDEVDAMPVPFKDSPLFDTSHPGKRLRIVAHEGGYQNKLEKWSTKDLCRLIDEDPARFSPDALLRPVYQEHILPNVAYTGGAGEMAYWLQLIPYFKQSGSLHASIRLRQSVAFWPHAAWRKYQQLGWTIADLHGDLASHRQQYLQNNKAPDLDDSRLTQQLAGMLEQAYKHHYPSLKPRVEGWLAAMEKHERRMNEAVRRNLSQTSDSDFQRMVHVTGNLWPSGYFQERHWTLLDVIHQMGPEAMDTLRETIDVKGPVWWWIHP